VATNATAVIAGDIGLHLLEADDSAVTRGGEHEEKNCEMREPLHVAIL
jgi:hypothetical protein